MSSGPSKSGKKGKGVVMTSARMGVRGEVGWRNNRASLNNSGTDHSFLHSLGGYFAGIRDTILSH